MKRVLAAIALLAAGCTGGGDGDPPCSTAGGALPEGLVTLSSHDGDASGSVRGQGFAITVDGEQFDLDEEPLWESVRFDLDRPARVHGYSVRWTHLDAFAGDALEAGLYPDFGHNGFDFWRDNPVFTGTRCASDASPDEPLVYVLDEPLEMEDPGLVYVGHLAPTPEWATFTFDSDFQGGGVCALWDECHSGFNLPAAWDGTYYGGVSLTFPYDFLVDLHVEWLDEVLPEERLFQPVTLPSTTDLALRAAWGDYDADGYDDLYVRGRRLYHNEGDGTFTLVANTASGLVGSSLSSGLWGDYDNDGCLDIYLFTDSTLSDNFLFHSNCDGTFLNVTSSAGVSTLWANVGITNPCPMAGYLHPQTDGAAWWDIDSDGWLDLYVSTYDCGLNEPPITDVVFHNNGDGAFEEWSGANGFLEEGFAARSALPFDHDGDGDVDLFVQNYRLNRNLFYRNDGGGTVTEIALENGTAGDPTVFEGDTHFGHTLGAAYGDLDGDGDFDLVEANLAHPRFYHFSDRTRVLLQDSPTGFFFDIANLWDFPGSGAGIRYQETYTSPALADFDQDGNLDLVLSARYSGRPTDFFWGNGDGTFELDSFHAGITTEDGWGLATSDFDNDGDLDLATTPTLFENVSAAAGNWVQVRAVGNVSSNRSAIGATVRVTAGGRTYLRVVSGGNAQGCQDSMSLHFGLGDATSIDSIRVAFPGGGTVTYPGPHPVSTRLWLYEDGTVTAGFAP